MRQLFSGDFDVDRILRGLAIESGVEIEPEKTLIILDEIQEVPAAVSAYLPKQSLSAVRRVQRRLISDYEQDFSKHAPTAVISRIRMVWDGIPLYAISQLWEVCDEF